VDINNFDIDQLYNDLAGGVDLMDMMDVGHPESHDDCGFGDVGDLPFDNDLFSESYFTHN